MDPTTPAPEAEPLLPRDWQVLGPLVDAVLDVAPELRAALIRELCAGDADRQRALEELVAECERDNPLLDRPAAERFVELATESVSLLPELVADRYQTGRELGRGGMARVYLARDLKHGRDVAIKVIRPELSASLGHDRFLRETAIAARLRHPNIVPLYDSGEVGGSLYFVMPYEEGPSLRERLSQEGALPVSDALSVLRDVARALAYAHERGVVHRDVKPDNVMLSGGAAVVTDFGIAKAVSAAQTTGVGLTLTQTGAAIGTPAYMAPEQAVGDPTTDHRADIYSFGCVAYELFAGKPPFHGSTHEVIAAHVGTVPPPVTTVRPDAPPFVADLIARCLAKKPEDRPNDARELLRSLDEATTVGVPTPSTPVLAAAAPRRMRVFAWSALALGVGVIGTVAYLVTQTPISVAVLPFGNIAADSAIDLVASGLADEVASVLARVPGIQIKSRSGARAYAKTMTVDIAEVGKRLKSDYVMQGSLRQDGEHWIVSADFERVSDAATLWDTAFTVSPDQQTGAAEAIAESLIAALQKQFPRSMGSAQRLAPNQRTSNPEAYRHNMRGQEILTRRTQSLKESADLFRLAIHEDTLFAHAYSGLSMALSLFPYIQGVPTKDVQVELVPAARRAIALDPTLAQPHVALGVSYGFDYLWNEAEAEFTTAIRLDRRNVEARIQYARHLRFRGRNQDAMQQLRVARAEDPASAVVLSHLAYSYYLNHQMDSALKESERAYENDSTNVTTVGYRALILLAAHRPAEARKFAYKRGVASGIYVLARVDTAAARAQLREWDAETSQRWGRGTRRAFTYLGLGELERALTSLEEATKTGEIWYGASSAFDPIFDPIRESPRFKALMRQVRLGQ